MDERTVEQTDIGGPQATFCRTFEELTHGPIGIGLDATAVTAAFRVPVSYSVQFVSSSSAHYDPSMECSL